MPASGSATPSSRRNKPWLPEPDPGMEERDARRLLAEASVASLATVDATNAPHLVPLVFALDGDTIYSAVDHKPKRSTRLKRLRNIEESPQVSLLVHHYEDDWSQLWWVRVDGNARVIATGDDWERAAELLADKYPPYRGQPPTGAVIAITIEKVTGWVASGA